MPGRPKLPTTLASDFGIHREQLVSITRDRDFSVLEQFGGVKGIADILKADEQKGLLGDYDDLLKRRNAFGSNTYPQKKGRSFWNFVWDAFHDITLLILIIAAAASLCLGVKSEDTKTTQMPPGQATKRRSTTSMSEANPVELPAASPVDAFASLSPVDASPSSQTVDIVPLLEASIGHGLENYRLEIIAFGIDARASSDYLDEVPMSDTSQSIAFFHKTLGSSFLYSWRLLQLVKEVKKLNLAAVSPEKLANRTEHLHVPNVEIILPFYAVEADIVRITGPSVKRVRGPTRGKNSSRLISQHGGKKLFVGVSIERRTFVGLNATKAANELGAQIRLQAPLQGTKNWEDVPPVIRAAIVQSLRDKFEIEGYDESPLPQEIIDTKATHLFKGWRYHMHEHYKELVKEGTDPYSKPFVGVSEEDWRYMIDEVFLGDTHKDRKRSTRNIANRKKLPYNHTMGSRSFSTAISIEGIETGKEPHIVDFFKTSHWSKKKKDWIEPVCAELYEKMDQLREESSQPGATPLTQEEITVQVLGKRSRYLRGFRVGPKPSSAFKSTTRS
ncbi:unnamed protein product [Camellia sinensis]